METKNTNLATKAFWIDLGNVLFFFDYGIFLDKIKDSLTMAPSQVKELIYTSEFVAQFERGLIDEEAFFKEFTAHTGLRMHKDYFFQAFADIFWENTPFIKFIKDQLKPNYRLILVSNINKVHYQFLAQQYPAIFKLFDHHILSYKVNVLKPDPVIYDAALKVSGGGVETVVYIDDRQDLIDATTAAGIESICFRTAQDCISLLSKRGIAVAG